MQIQLAQHTDPVEYWEGGNFELNMSYEMLQGDDWKRVIEALWANESIVGPLVSRFVPGQEIPETHAIEIPEPTAALTQHGILHVGEQAIGIDVLITRSLFECITLMAPVGMFANLTAGSKSNPYPLNDNPARQSLEKTYRELALTLFKVVPFSIASLGWNRECQLLAELTFEEDALKNFLSTGNSLITDKALKACKVDPTSYEEMLPGLRWLAPTG
ncbi:MAG: hypothetical protein L0154_28965 [Chloroflexi bacterium]|nr:hypothetical protein [Chloroflexota bacterium]